MGDKVGDKIMISLFCFLLCKGAYSVKAPIIKKNIWETFDFSVLLLMQRIFFRKTELLAMR